jgi:hypothetical protein
VYAVNVGEQLLQPEDGWKRYDDTDDYILYQGDWQKLIIYDKYYQNTVHTLVNHVSTQNDTITFMFQGNKIRLVGGFASNQSKTVQVTIDGQKSYYSAYNDKLLRGHLLYENTDLSDTVHQVEIKALDGKGIILDAIEINDLGELLNPYEKPVISASIENQNVKLTWNDVMFAEKYIVKRSTESGGPYTTVSEVVYGSYTNYIDEQVELNNKYFYVVETIYTNGKHITSNEVSVSFETPNSDRALLVITMINGLEREYDLSIDEVNKFISWYDDRTNSLGNTYYIFNNDRLGPFTSRKDYLVFDKIMCFEVMEYTTK